MNSIEDPQLGLSPSNPLLVGDHPALDFLNSVLKPGAQTVDFLQDGASLAAWMGGSGVLPAEMANAVGQWPKDQQDTLAAQARTLREELRRFLMARGAPAGRALNVNDVGFINLWLSHSPLVQRLTWLDDHYHLHLQRDTTNPLGVTAALAELCAGIIANQPEDQVRKCENPACTLWFNDNKRGPRRRWCSMAICGNRMKVAAHRARRKDAPGGDSEDG
jgi:predicted RNA-binding Zn ribbon-like protein